MKQCPKSGSCGACAFNGVKYSKQLQEKQKYVEKQIAKFGPVAPILGMADPFYYRNKIQSVFGTDSKGNIVNGIYRQGTHSIIPVSGCMLEDKEGDAVLSSVKEFVKKRKITAYDEDEHKGFLRHVLIRRGVATNQTMVVLVVSSFNFKQKNDFVRELTQKHPSVKTILLNRNTEQTSMVLSDEPEKIIYGDGYIVDELCGLHFRISAKSFYQVNPYQTAKLYTIAMRMARFKGNEKVIDAYCGTGTIGLIASQYAKEVVGIELNPQAVADAENNAQINNISNVSFITADASLKLKEMAKNKESADVVFMDPPRSGSDERFLASLIKLSPKTIIYISCNPETLSRDLRYLCNMSNYSVIGAQPVDMFPQTSHLETVVLLSGQKIDSHISIDLDVEKLEGKSGTATYDEIKEYIEKKYGMKVSTLYIGQIKDKVGIKERKNYNVGSGKGRVPTCPKEKEEAIMDAFRHFRLI